MICVNLGAWLILDHVNLRCLLNAWAMGFFFDRDHNFMEDDITIWGLISTRVDMSLQETLLGIKYSALVAKFKLCTLSSNGSTQQS